MRKDFDVPVAAHPMTAEKLKGHLIVDEFLEDGDLILSDTLEMETLDFLEIQASIESITLAAATHMEQIRNLANGGEG